MPSSIACPNCGAPLTLESAFTTFLVCGYCGQSLFVRDTGVDLAGQAAKLADYPSRLAVGKAGQMKGQAFKTLGRLRYDTDSGYWDEWFVQLANLQVAWLLEDEGVVFDDKERVDLALFGWAPDPDWLKERGYAQWEQSGGAKGQAKLF